MLGGQNNLCGNRLELGTSVWAHGYLNVDKWLHTHTHTQRFVYTHIGPSSVNWEGLETTIFQ